MSNPDACPSAPSADAARYLCAELKVRSSCSFEYVLSNAADFLFGSQCLYQHESQEACTFSQCAEAARYLCTEFKVKVNGSCSFDWIAMEVRVT
mmetsp:Transcript_83210/g.152160  ORF Transcript_83210/g.152160 Transcript_83210/m.152160 type:complete len:94 (+) Transcript_83210:40-321(+)